MSPDALPGRSAWSQRALAAYGAAVLVTLLATPIGTVAAYGMHCGATRLRDAMRLLVLLPIVVPTVLVAVGVFHLYAILDLNYTLAGVVLAHTALAVPFVVISVLASLRSCDMTQEMAARHVVLAVSGVKQVVSPLFLCCTSGT